MDPERFRESPVGRLVPITVVDGDRRWSHEAFVPDPLPREIELSQETWAAVTDATEALGRLDGAANRLPNPYLLVRPALTKEAVSTSALEGTYASIEDVFRAQLLDEADVSASTAEVRNYVWAAEHGLELIKTLPISRRLVTEVHAVLMHGSRGDYAEVGSFRRRQNWIGTRRGQPVTESLFVPPPPGELLDQGLDDWERWVNDDSIRLPILIKVALAHYQFETLHPFIDGNGRVGRLLIVLTLVESRNLRVPLLNVSPFFEDTRDEYIDHLRFISETGEFEQWIAFFAEAVRVQSERALAKADDLVNARDDIIGRLHAANVRGVAIRIAEDLIGFPLVTPSRAAEKFNVTYETANSAIGRLEEQGIVEETTGRTYARMFMSRRIVEIANR
ncbi:MAG TPA: Fic/DOC family N-terminal domain-containing protein [Gaiellaceae bacterium]